MGGRFYYLCLDGVYLFFYYRDAYRCEIYYRFVYFVVVWGVVKSVLKHEFSMQHRDSILAFDL